MLVLFLASHTGVVSCSFDVGWTPQGLANARNQPETGALGRAELLGLGLAVEDGGRINTIMVEHVETCFKKNIKDSKYFFFLLVVVFGYLVLKSVQIVQVQEKTDLVRYFWHVEGPPFLEYRRLTPKIRRRWYEGNPGSPLSKSPSSWFSQLLHNFCWWMHVNTEYH